MLFVGDEHHHSLEFLCAVVAHGGAKVFVKALGFRCFEDDVIVTLQYVFIGHIGLKAMTFFDQGSAGTQEAMAPIGG
jgi:hypothetical protein